jgi:hypothetical protein
VSPLFQFTAYFLLVSAMTAVVNTYVQVEDPRQAGSHALRFFLWIVGGIAAFSVVVYFLSWWLIRKP